MSGLVGKFELIDGVRKRRLEIKGQRRGAGLSTYKGWFCVPQKAIWMTQFFSFQYTGLPAMFLGILARRLGHAIHCEIRLPFLSFRKDACMLCFSFRRAYSVRMRMNSAIRCKLRATITHDWVSKDSSLIKWSGSFRVLVFLLKVNSFLIHATCICSPLTVIVFNSVFDPDWKS